MVKIYYRLIKSGKLELRDVPREWRDEVRRLLQQDKE